MQHCQYITVECRNTGCGERVLLTRIEHHLKNECLYRLIKCKDCGKKILSKDLKVSDIYHISTKWTLWLI